MSMANAQKMGYTVKQKIDICLMAEANPDMTQADLANWAKKKYHTIRPPSQTTISRILSKKNELIALKEHEFKLIRRRKPSNVLLREILNEWISQSVWDNIPISIPLVQNSATSLWKILPLNSKEGNGEFSHKWCNHFLSKLNVNLNSLETELIKPSKIWNLQSERLELKNYLKQFNLKDIFVLDEFFLYYKLPLDEKLVHNENNDNTNNNPILHNKNGVTVLLTTNADGSEKLEPLLIGHYENMICFDGKPATKISKKYELSYKSNKKAWLTSIQLSDWLSTLDKRLSIASRDIVLLLDDSASHRVVNMKLDYIKLVFIHNPNLDNINQFDQINNRINSQRQKFLPMELGILREFKVLYRLQQYLLSINLQGKSKNQLLNTNQFSLSLTDVMIMIKNSWSNVSIEVIRNAFINADIIDFEEYTNQQFELDNQLNKNLNVIHKAVWGDSTVEDNNNNNSDLHNTASLSQNTATDFKNSEFKLLQMIKKLTVSQPWEIDHLTNLEYEDKFLIYKTPVEMVDSCIIEEYEPNEIPNNNNNELKDNLQTSLLAQTFKRSNDIKKEELSPQSFDNNNNNNNNIISQQQFPTLQSNNGQFDNYFDNLIPEENNDFKFDFNNDKKNNDFNLFNYDDNNKPEIFNDFNFGNVDSNLFGFDSTRDNQYFNNNNERDVNDNNTNNDMNFVHKPQYNQHVNRYTSNSLFSEPVKKGLMSSVITIPDNSKSFGVLYSKKRKVSTMENDNENLFNSPTNKGESVSKSDSLGYSNQNSSVSSPRNFAEQPDLINPKNISNNGLNLGNFVNNNSNVSSLNNVMNSSNNGLSLQKKINLLVTIITATNNGEFNLSENCINELRTQLFTEFNNAQQQNQIFNDGGSNSDNNSLDLDNLSQYLTESLELEKLSNTSNR